MFSKPFWMPYRVQELFPTLMDWLFIPNEWFLRNLKTSNSASGLTWYWNPVRKDEEFWTDNCEKMAKKAVLQERRTPN